MTTFFFERYGPAIFRGLNKWCCERVLRRFRLFRGKKNFFLKTCFFDFFCISGVTDFLKNEQLLFWEIPAWNLSWTAQMVLRTNFKAFKSVSSEKKFFQKFKIFWLFLHIRGHRFLEKWPTSFDRYRPEICRGLHKWCCERILRRFGSFWAKKIFFENSRFLTFLHNRGHRFLEKWPTSFLRDTGLQFLVDYTNGVANEF